jgi:hypothetical protein
MSRLSPLTTLEPQFDAFLFASIGDDENGLSLSVVSALARMGLDPWQEASTLAALPAVAAAQRFALLFKSLPNESLSDAERAALTTRLIGLLPRPVRREPGKLLTLPYSRLGTGALILAAALLLLAAQFVMARHIYSTPSSAAHPENSMAGSPGISIPQLDE